MLQLWLPFLVTTALPKTSLGMFVLGSGGSRPSAKEGAHLTMNVEFCEDNSSTSKKMRFFRQNKEGGPDPPGPSPGSATLRVLLCLATKLRDTIPLKSLKENTFLNKSFISL